MGKRGFCIDKRIEDLVIVRGREIKQLTNGLLFGPRVFPPLSLELKYPLFPLTQA